MSILEVDLTPEMDHQLRQAASRRGVVAAEYARTALAKVLQEEPADPTLHSIMEFEGIGREALQGIDVDAFLREMCNDND